MKNLFKYYISYTPIIIFNIFLFSDTILFAQDQLPIKNIEVEPIANYKNSPEYSNPYKLFDNKFATGKIFWTDPNSLGWKNYGQITMDIQLDSEVNIYSISLRTAKNEAADVYFPLNVNLFISNDGKSYHYLGDISPREIVQENVYSSITMKKENINLNAKFIKIVVVPQGNMFFTDEIVIKGNKQTAKKASSSALNATQITNIISDNKKSEINRRLLLNKLLNTTNVSSNRLNLLKKEVLEADDLSNNTVYQNYLNTINTLSLSKDKSEGIQLQILSSPWGNGTTIGGRTSILNAVNLTHYIAIEAFNNQNKGYSGKFTLNGIRDLEVEVYEAADVKTRKSVTVKDALIPFEPSSIITFAPGERKIIVMALKSRQVLKSDIKINIGQDIQSSLSLLVNFINIGINEEFISSLEFNVNVWPYYNSLFFKGKETEIEKDLKEHYSNIFVIPASILEPNNLVTDHSKLRTYLNYYNANEKVLLFLNYRGYIDNPGNFLQQPWKDKYLSWYDQVMKIFDDFDIDKSSVYIYPFDEIKANEVPALSEFTTWIKSERPNSKIYTTVFDEKILPQILPYVDIVQLLASSNNLLSNKLLDIGTCWIYDIMDDSKGVDPYSRYRLLAWKAFNIKAKGIGFWAYADQFGDSIWDDFDGSRSDYNVVYNQGTTIISSRRWEAFKQGIEDYFILCKYSEQFGSAEAIKVTAPVFASPENLEMAEKVRNDMLEKLQVSK